MRELLRAILKTVFGSFAALLLGMVAVKTIATFNGPDGVGLFSLLRQTQQVAILLAMVNGQNAIVQGIASRQGQERAGYVSVAFWIVLAVLAVILVIFVSMPGQLTHWLLGQSVAVAATAESVRVLGLSVFFGVVFTFCIGILNGHGMVGRAAVVQVANQAVLALFAYPMVAMASGVPPSAFGWLLVSGTAVAALLGVVLVLRARLVRISLPRWTEATSKAARHFLRLSSGLLVAGVVSAAVPLTVRVMVARGFDLAGAGVFDAAWTLSMAYVLIVLASFSSYYLPTLSGMRDPQERRVLIALVFRVAIILMVPLVTAVIVLKPLVITLLYSEEFMPSVVIIRWMLLGDYFKVMSWVFSYTMLAYADLRMFISTELVWGGLTLAASFVSVFVFRSLEALGICFALLTAVYFLLMVGYVRVRHGFHLDRRAVLQSGSGLALAAVASILTWNDTVVCWPVAISCVLAAVVTSAMMLKGEERGAIYSFVRRPTIVKH